MVLAVAAGVVAGAVAGPLPPWALATTIGLAVLLAGALLHGAWGPMPVPASGTGRLLGWGRPGSSAGFAGSSWAAMGSRPAAHGVLGLALLALAGAGVAGSRAAAVRAGVLVGLVGHGGTVTVDATVAEEPDLVRYGGRWVVLSARRVESAGQARRTRERVGVILPRAAGPIAVGDRLRVSAGVERAKRTDPLGGEPGTVLRRPRIISRAPSRSRLLRASESVRAAARHRALDTLPPERAGLLVGIALGDTSLLPADLDRAFTTAGLTHLTAVSGQNLAVVLAAGLGIAVVLGAGRPLLATLGILFIALFALLTRWEPSVLRASAMAVLALLGVATGRGPGGRRALCLAVTLLLLANPALLSSIGFRLSVAATAGVLWLGPSAMRVLPRGLPGVVRSAVGISLGAQAGATPVLALTFGQISVAGLAANLVAVPLAVAPMLLGVVAAAASAVPPLTAVAVIACRLADPFLAALVAVAEHAGNLPGASISLSGPVRLLPAIAVLAATILVRRRAAALVVQQEAERHRRRRFRARDPAAEVGNVEERRHPSPRDPLSGRHGADPP